MALPVFTVSDIRKLGPCYDPIRHVPEDWSGTLLDILRMSNVPAEDRIWAVTGLLDDRTSRLFAVWNGRLALERYSPNPDPRSIAACDVAERFANGQATSEELAAARAAARAAAMDAAMDAAWDAARDAARDAAMDAAWDAARAAAWDAARDAAREEQITKLIEMITG